jgi:hypothetical protein
VRDWKLATVQIKKEELKEVKDFNSLLAKLNELYDGKWVAILDNNDLVADKTVQSVQKLAEKKNSKIVFLFHASKKGELLL